MKTKIGSIAKGFAGLLSVAVLAPSPNAHAFFNTTDRTEIRSILPNETAFWIEDTSSNPDAQAQDNSEQFLAAKKVHLSRKEIPHTKLQGSGGKSMMSGWDYFVPTGRLIIVNRTPFSREWVASENRGTSTKDQGIHCQDKNGLNITVGVSIVASILPENAARYLYNFGVVPPAGDPTDGNVIFTSIYYSRSLTDVMDDIGHKRVQTLICREIQSRTLDEDNEQANQIMDKVVEQTRKYLADVGITLSFLGWADTFTFDAKVQDAINRVYISSKDAEVAKNLQQWIPVLQGQATAETIRDFGAKTDGKLPTTLVGIPNSIPSMLKSLLGTYVNDMTEKVNGGKQ